MTLPVLNLPKSAHFKLYWLPAQFAVNRMQSWGKKIAHFPLQKRIQVCLRKLPRLNKAYYQPRTRLALLNALQLSLHDCFKSEKQLIRDSHSTQNDTATATQELDKLYEELANGYKLVIHAIAKTTILTEAESLLIQEAIYFALKFLARRLLLAYAQYLPVPKGGWRELHQIYRYADEYALLFHIIDDPVSDSSFPVFHSGDLIYKRMTLVGLAEPYRLMQDECIELYNLTSRWTSACSLFPLGKLAIHGEHVVDLADDLPPRFVTPDLSWQPLDGRVIDITEVVQRVEKDLSGLLHNDPLVNEFDLLDLEERQKRDMLLRVINTYQGKPVRRSKRFELNETVEFVTNINACHHFLLKKKNFSPEMDELKLLSALVKNAPESNSDDFSTRYKQALETDQRYQRSGFTLYKASQLNINPLGLALEYQTGQQTMISVGELIAYRFCNKSKPRWQLGSACWLKQVDDSICRFGIMNLSNNAIPVAVKATSDKTGQRNYIRALLIPRHVSHQQVRSLVLPSLSFDINSELILNMGRSLMYIRLSRMLVSTRAFSQFEFEVKRQPLDFLL